VIAVATVRRVAADLTPASGTIVGFTVPDGERWRPGLIHLEATTGLSHVRAQLKDETGALGNIELTVNDTNGENIDVRGLILDAGDVIGAVTTGNGADTSRIFEMELQVEARE